MMCKGSAWTREGNMMCILKWKMDKGVHYDVQIKRED